jgi:hypothetical protein
VLAITDDDAANLAVAIASRLINPRLMVVARVASPAVERNMMSFGTHYVVNHFERSPTIWRRRFIRRTGSAWSICSPVCRARKFPSATIHRPATGWSVATVASGRRWCAISNGTA